MCCKHDPPFPHPRTWLEYDHFYFVDGDDDDDDDDDDNDDDGNDDGDESSDGDDDLLLLHCLSLACVPPPQLALHAPQGPHSLQPDGLGHHDHH